MTESEIATFELVRSLNERAAVLEREALVLQAQYNQAVKDAADLRARAKVHAEELGITCA